MKKFILFVISLFCLTTLRGFAQDELQISDVLVIPPLFEYPVAPEELESLQDKTDYLMEHFWDAFDFKNENVVDQIALNDAFSVYASSMAYATPSKVEDSVKKLIGKIKNNAALSFQFTKSAEENLYGPRADIWYDEIYIRFLENLISNKKIDNNKKIKYRKQLDVLKNTQPGNVFPSFKYKDISGRLDEFRPKKELTLIAIGDPECEDCRYIRLKMDISSVLNDLLSENKIQVFFIIPDNNADIKSVAHDFPSKWNLLASTEVLDKYDLRTNPGFYLLDKEGKIIAKNISVDQAIDIVDDIRNLKQ